MAINSHIKVRKMIQNSGNIKNKDFFLNKVFKEHLEDIATNITKRYTGNRRVKVSVGWDTKESAPVACTNNSVVFLNAGATFIHSSAIKSLYRRVLGLFAHELGHVLWTDFPTTNSYINGLERGLWFPRKPRLVNYEMQVNEQEFWALCKQGPEFLKMVIDFVLQISNIPEDGFVEEQFLRAFAGILGIGLEEVRALHWNSMKELSLMIDEEDSGDISKHKLFTMFALLLQYSKYGEVKCDGVPYDDEHLVMLGKLMPLVDEYMQSPPRERCALVSEMTLVMFPWLKDCIEAFVEQSQEQGDGSSGQGQGQGQNQGQGSSQMNGNQANALNQLIQNTVQGMAGNTQQAQGNTSACASIKGNAGSNTQTSQNRAKTSSQIPSDPEFKIGQGKESQSDDGSDEANGAVGGDESGDGEEIGAIGNNSGDEENGDAEGCGAGENGSEGCSEGDDGEGTVNPSNGSSGESRKQFDGEGSQIGYGEGECLDGNGSGQVDYNAEYEAEIDANLESKINSLMEEMKENKAIKTLEGERTRELNRFANDISYGNAHKGIDIRVNRAEEISDEMIETYKKVAVDLLPIAKNLARKFLQIADDARSGGRLNGLLMGRKFDAAAAYRKDGKVFMKNIMPQDMQPIAVTLLLDESGSMNGKRAEVAMATAIILQNFCEQLNIPIAIYGHSTGYYNCELYSYLEFDTYTKKDKYRLVDIGARGCNRDGAALRYAAERLMTRPEEAKLLILVSDGQPNGDYDYCGAKAEADLRGIQKEYTKKGVCFCAAAIGDDKDIIKGIYGDAFLDISDLNQLPVKLVKVLSRYLHTV